MARSSRAPVQVAEFELQQLEPELARHAMGRDVEFRAGAARRTAGIIGEFHERIPRPRIRRAASRPRSCTEQSLERVDLAADQQAQNARQICECAQALHAQHQRARIDPAARRDDGA